MQQHQRLGALVGLHLQHVQPALQADQAEQADRENHHRDQHFDQRNAALRTSVHLHAHHLSSAPALVLTPALVSDRSPSTAWTPFAVKSIVKLGGGPASRVDFLERVLLADLGRQCVAELGVGRERAIADEELPLPVGDVHHHRLGGAPVAAPDGLPVGRNRNRRQDGDDHDDDHQLDQRETGLFLHAAHHSGPARSLVTTGPGNPVSRRAAADGR